MEQVKSPATVEERTCSVQTVTERELLGTEEKSQPVHCCREWRQCVGYTHLDKPW